MDFKFTKNAYIRGTEVNYYFICKTKLWLFSHNIQLEKEHENVKIGKLIQKRSFKREEKDVRLGPVAFDFIRKKDKIELHETKKSSSMQKAHKFQVLYYLYYLKKKGIEAEAVIHFPKQRKKEKIELEENKIKKVQKILKKIKKIKDKKEMSQPKEKKICNKCAYYELCWV